MHERLRSKKLKIGWKQKDKTESRSILSEQEFLLQILETCAQFPDLHNPVDQNGNCYYSANEITMKGALVNEHCLIGQWWINQGNPKSELPEGKIAANMFLSIAADMFLSDHDYPQNICSLARLVQDMADRRPMTYSTSVVPPPWRDVAVRIKNTFAVELRQT